MNTLSRRQFIILNLQLLVWASLSGCRSSYPVLGTSPMLKPLIVENHSQLLAKWAERGIRDAVLINIDTHDDIRWVSDEKVGKLREIYQQRDWMRFAEADSIADRGLYHIGNWIYAGARLGVFKEVCWVIPANLFSQPNPDDLLRKFLKHFRFNEDDIRTFTARDNRFHGSCRGIPVTICGIEYLPVIKQPLLLSIDTDFFPTYTDNYQVEYLSALHATFDALYKKHYLIRDSAICYSVNGDYLLPIHRWVGDTITSILNKPGMINDAPSELLSLLQQCDSAYRSGEAAAILKLVEQPLLKQQMPSLMLYKAYAHLLQGNPNKSFEAAMRCCDVDPLYCTSLPYLATLYYTNGQYQQAEKFFRAGFTANPSMECGVFRFANCLRKVGKLREAISWFEKSDALIGSFPSRVLTAEIHLKLGDRQAATADIKLVLSRLEQDIYAKVTSQSLANSIYAIIDYCDKNGFREIAASLKITSAIKEMIRDYPAPKPDAM
jgi:tetratricopeptide (TPR) repeat protein